MSNQKYRQRAKRHAFIFVLVVLLSCVGLWLLYDWQNQRSLVGVYFQGSGHKTETFLLELAVDDASRHKGLMFRKSMDADRGMLFIFPRLEEHSFYMKNTYLPLDMVFLDQGRTVVGVLENVPVLNEQPRSVGVASQYVIELNGGAAKSEGISVGYRAIFDRQLPQVE